MSYGRWLTKAFANTSLRQKLKSFVEMNTILLVCATGKILNDVDIKPFVIWIWEQWSNLGIWTVFSVSILSKVSSLEHGRILDIFLPGVKHSKVENPFHISAYISILDPNKTVLILIRQGCSPACSYGAYAYGLEPRSPVWECVHSSSWAIWMAIKVNEKLSTMNSVTVS